MIQMAALIDLLIELYGDIRKGVLHLPKHAPEELCSRIRTNLFMSEDMNDWYRKQRQNGFIPRVFFDPDRWDRELKVSIYFEGEFGMWISVGAGRLLAESDMEDNELIEFLLTLGEPVPE